MKVSGFIMLFAMCLIPCAINGVTFQESGMPLFAAIFVLMPLTILTERH